MAACGDPNAEPLNDLLCGGQLWTFGCPLPSYPVHWAVGTTVRKTGQLSRKLDNCPVAPKLELILSKKSADQYSTSTIGAKDLIKVMRAAQALVDRALEVSGRA